MQLRSITRKFALAGGVAKRRETIRATDILKNEEKSKFTFVDEITPSTLCTAEHCDGNSDHCLDNHRKTPAEADASLGHWERKIWDAHRFEANVHQVTFNIGRRGKLQHSIYFDEFAVTPAKAVAAVEDYFSQPLTKDYYEMLRLANDLITFKGQVEEWNDDMKKKNRGSCLSAAQFLESCTVFVDPRTKRGWMQMSVGT